MRENRLRWFDHVRRKPTDTPVQRVKFINLGQVKKNEGKTEENMDGGDTTKYRG